MQNELKQKMSYGHLSQVERDEKKSTLIELLDLRGENESLRWQLSIL